MSFEKRIEDFVCAKCGTSVQGSGYTNHCPQCLWSQHVDNDPGDRAAECGGMMAPLRVEGGTGHFRILHRCTTCGIERRVDTTTSDSVDALFALASKNAGAIMGP